MVPARNSKFRRVSRIEYLIFLSHSNSFIDDEEARRNTRITKAKEKNISENTSYGIGSKTPFTLCVTSQ